MLSILDVVDLWCPYLLGKRFQIKNDHHSLKYFLEQIISSPEQQRWVTKLFGYDYEIIYNKGKENVVIDDFSTKMKKMGPSFPSHYFRKLDCSSGMVATPQTFYPNPKIATGSSGFTRVLLAQ
jgi:hypothetical protein